MDGYSEEIKHVILTNTSNGILKL